MRAGAHQWGDFPRLQAAQQLLLALQRRRGHLALPSTAGLTGCCELRGESICRGCGHRRARLIGLAGRGALGRRSRAAARHSVDRRAVWAADVLRWLRGHEDPRARVASDLRMRRIIGRARPGVCAAAVPGRRVA